MNQFLSGLTNLQLANNWSRVALYGNCVCSLKGEALLWHSSQPDDAFKTEGVFHFDKLAAQLKVKFKSQGDLLCEIMEIKQGRGSVDAYIEKMLDKFSLVPDLSEEMKIGLLCRNFTPAISRGLVLRNFTSLSECENMAKRLETVVLTKPTSTSQLRSQRFNV